MYVYKLILEYNIHSWLTEEKHEKKMSKSKIWNENNLILQLNHKHATQ